MQCMVLDWYKLVLYDWESLECTWENLYKKTVVDDVRELLFIFSVVNFIKYYYLKEIALII